MAQAPNIDTFLATYQKLNKTNLHLLGNIYTSDVVFIDPVHDVHGLSALKQYMSKLYAGATSVSFEYHHQIQQEHDAVVVWTMSFKNSKLSGGNLITVHGSTHLTFDPVSGKVRYHRDYFDLGQMLYEHIAVLGGAVKLIKARLSA